MILHQPRVLPGIGQNDPVTIYDSDPHPRFPPESIGRSCEFVAPVPVQQVADMASQHVPGVTQAVLDLFQHRLTLPSRY